MAPAPRTYRVFATSTDGKHQIYLSFHASQCGEIANIIGGWDFLSGRDRSVLARSCRELVAAAEVVAVVKAAMQKAGQKSGLSNSDY